MNTLKTACNLSLERVKSTHSCLCQYEQSLWLRNTSSSIRSNNTALIKCMHLLHKKTKHASLDKIQRPSLTNTQKLQL